MDWCNKLIEGCKRIFMLELYKRKMEVDLLLDLNNIYEFWLFISVVSSANFPEPSPHILSSIHPNSYALDYVCYHTRDSFYL